MCACLLLEVLPAGVVLQLVAASGVGSGVAAALLAKADADCWLGGPKHFILPKIFKFALQAFIFTNFV